MLRIVLVEDNPADAQMLGTALRETGQPVEILRLGDGFRALEYLNGSQSSYVPGSRCDLVLLDLNLPRLNGVEILERIRACDRLKALPVIVMSGSNDPLDIERSYRAGANSFICKPAHLDDIFAMASQFMTYWSACVQLPAPRCAQAVSRGKGNGAS